MNYIGIDPSTKTGIVILDKNGEVMHKEEITSNKKGDLDRFDDIAQQVKSLVKKTDKVTIEGFSYGSRGRGVSTQYGIGWILRYVLYYAGVDFVEVPPTTLKKFATGKGNTKKENMIIPIYKRYGFEDESDNIRDAYVLAQIARALDGKGEHTKAQISTLKGLK